MRKNGFTLVEIVVAVFIIGLIATIGIKVLNPTPEAKVIACQAEMLAYYESIESMRENGPAPTWEQVQNELGSRWKDHYHYIVNNSDANKGHGNDIDFCDEENPGQSLANRECLNLKYIILCDHDHSLAGIKYNAMVESWETPSPFAVPLDPINPGDNGKGKGKKKVVERGDVLQQGNNHVFLRDIFYWTRKDPNWQRWINR
jgi:prepilin-type N-terminal cleavage/methylation domain-containing protein